MDDLSPSLLTPPTSLSSSLPQLPHTTRDQVQSSTDQTAQSRQPQIVTRPKSVIVFNRSRPLPSGTKPRVEEPDIMEVAVALHDDDASGSVDSPAPSSPLSSVSSVEFSSASSSPNSPSSSSSSSSPESNSDFNQPGWVAVAGPSGLNKEDRSAAFASDGKRAANLRATPPPQAPYEVVDLEDVDDIDYSGYDSDIEFIADLGMPAPGTVRPRPPEFDNDNARDGNAEDDSDDDCQIVFEKPIKRFRRNPEDVNADEPIEAAVAAVAAAAAAVTAAAAAVVAAVPVDVVAPPNENNGDDNDEDMDEDDEDEVDNRGADQQQGAAGDGQIDDDVRDLAEILDEIVDHELVVRQEQVVRQEPVVAHGQVVVQAPAVVGQPIVEGPVVGQLPPPPAQPPVHAPANAIDPDEALRMDMHVIDEHLTDYMNQQIPIHNVSSDDEDDDDVVVEEEEIQQNLNDEDVIFMHRILGPQQARRPTLHLNELAEFRALRDELALGPRPYRPPTPFAVVGAPAAAAPAALPTPPPPPPPQIEIQIREVEVVREVVRVEVRTEVRQERVPGLVCSICFDDTLPDENATPPPPPPPATRNRPRPAGALGPSGAPRAENPWDPKFWSINCGHIYCEECINSILTNNPKNCAVCRKRFTRKQTHRIYMTA